MEIAALASTTNKLGKLLNLVAVKIAASASTMDMLDNLLVKIVALAGGWIRQDKIRYHNAKIVPKASGRIKLHERWIHNASFVPKASGRQPLV